MASRKPAINTIGEEGRETKIKIDWLSRYQLTAVRTARDMKRVGIYIIEKKDFSTIRRTYKPIYVGSGTSARGIKQRFEEHVSDCFNRFKLNPDELGFTVKIGFVSPSDKTKNAENIIIRTFNRKSPHYPNKLTNKTKSQETNLIKIKGEIKLIFTGLPPRYLIERLDRLSRDTDVVEKSPETVEGSLYIYKLTTTEETGHYESFADSLTLRELRELEWV